MPRSLALMSKAIDAKIPAELMAKLHVNDLQLLILKTDIHNLENIIQMLAKDKKKNVKDVDSDTAVNFLKGGGQHG